MKEADIKGHRTRSSAAYHTLANQFIAEPLSKNQFSYNDLVTLIEMRDDATTYSLIDSEPITWELYNELVGLAQQPQRPRTNGNYIPALKKAFRALLEKAKPGQALSLFFLSDGAPSDYYPHSLVDRSTGLKNIDKAKNEIYELVADISSHFKKRLTFGCFGFANTRKTNFEVLKLMAEKADSSGAMGLFLSGQDTKTLRMALNRMATSLTMTRLSLSSLGNNQNY